MVELGSSVSDTNRKNPSTPSPVSGTDSDSRAGRSRLGTIGAALSDSSYASKNAVRS